MNAVNIKIQYFFTQEMRKFYNINNLNRYLKMQLKNQTLKTAVKEFDYAKKVFVLHNQR